MKAPTFVLLLVAAYSISARAAIAQEYLPKEVCDKVGVRLCHVKSVDAFSAVDLNGDGKKEIIFAYDGGSCGEQHYVYARKKNEWIEIANWCGMDGGAYNVLRSKHNGYFDIDTYLGVIRFDGTKYPNTTTK